MYNILLDRLPTEYEGYLIRTSFRIGMQICLCLNDNDYTEDERLLIALSLLYGNGIPSDPEVAVKGLSWFMCCADDSKKQAPKSNDKTLIYWDFDHERIYSSFQQTYNIDLTKEDMHWFKFIALLGSLNKDSALNNVIQIRDFDLSEMKGKARTDMIKMKKSVTPELTLSKEEQEQVDKVFALFDGGGINE